MGRDTDRLAGRLARLAAEAPSHTAFHLAADEQLRGRVSYDASAWTTVDPGSGLHTSCVTPGVEHDPARDELVFASEYLHDDVNRFVDLAASSQRAASLWEATGGRMDRSWRFRQIPPPVAIADELRLACVDAAGACWANVALFRFDGGVPFSPEDVELAAGVGPSIAAGVRLTLLRQAVDRPEALDDPPGTLLVSQGRITATTEPAERWMDRLGGERQHSAITAVATRAGDRAASVRIAAADGTWIGLHAAPVKGDDDVVAVIIERVRPAALADLIVAALGLTPREREVAEQILTGRSTQQAASQLGVSAWTIQDHLKAIFAKAGVASRGELAAMLRQEHYEPRVRRGTPPGPYGWFLEDDAGR